MLFLDNHIRTITGININNEAGSAEFQQGKLVHYGTLSAA